VLWILHADGIELQEEDNHHLMKGYSHYWAFRSCWGHVRPTGTSRNSKSCATCQNPSDAPDCGLPVPIQRHINFVIELLEQGVDITPVLSDCDTVVI
jgi:hypothetical protein